MAHNVDNDSSTSGSAPAAPSIDAATSPSLQASGKRKLSRTALTLREKAIVKSFCEQKVNDCKARGESVPSQEALRREVAAQFGWSCGRSTLSKIMSMDWRLLRSGEQGGDAPRNPNMKRRRRPLFPAFEADLVKFIACHVGAERGGESGAHAVAGSAEDEAGGDQQPGDQSSGDRSRVLTEALILEEAQRLKQVHGVSDEMLVLSVGWLARFKHRHCIRLRKSAGVSSRSPLHQTVGVMTGSGSEAASLGGWDADVVVPSLSQAAVPKEESIAHPPASADDNGDADMLSSRDQQAAHLPLGSNATPSPSPPRFTKRAALCSAQWCQRDSTKPPSMLAALIEQIPANIRDLACSCQSSAGDDDFKGGIVGLRVAVVGFGSVVKAFLAAALVGADGFVTCVDASPSNVYLAEQAAESYCREKLGLPLVNMKFIVGEYGGMAQSSSLAALGSDELKAVRGQADLAICNCSIQSLEFPASKNAMLEVAFSLLKVGGELRVTDLVCTRRLSSSECEEARFAMEASAGAEGSATVGGVTKQFEQKLLLSAPYVGDLQRLYRSLSSNIEVRRTSCTEFEAIAIDAAVNSLLPTLAAGGVHYRRVTFRAFRLQDVEDPCEDYGQTAIFKGIDARNDQAVDAEDLSRCYRLDDDWYFQKGAPRSICAMR
ncbi:hypothetical protein PF005_g17618 [Phytophthora fragariae]|uniref:Uncharacterized protein n=1 Tax=Phytophthora fragariae TaxID=53985 RepID=A0A6A3X1Z6_9STRA|nr:hypothetical protein PF003_g23190 [Phytophthora fragariae]KAE9194601.1 hypothetical protein PF005_g17618 [Phytophthora fragariae]KAE9295649.1 hypothetical protein PF001_g17234 [Phytophthora fragariae]